MSAAAQYLINRYTALSVPHTGDSGVPSWVYIVMGVSLVAIIALMVLGRKNNGGGPEE